MNIHIDLPPTEEGAKLLLNMEKSSVYRNKIMEAVYEKSQDSDGYCFKCEYDEEIDYGGNCVIVPVSSIFQGIEVWRDGQEFANVLGSVNDKGKYGKKSMVWHKIYDEVGLPWEKYEQTGFYDCDTNELLTDGKFTCIESIIGGHVIKGTRPVRLNRGDEVYIVPICQQHNTVNAQHGIPNSTPGNGNGFYMKLSGNKEVVKMTGFLLNNTVEEYIK